MYVYGPDPPLGITEAVPSADPLHEVFVDEGVSVTAGGSVITAVEVFVHPFESVVVTIYVPGAKFVAVIVVWTGVVLHE